jgi:hypothetical protein
MASFVRQGVIAVSIGMLLFCISCEKHPLGQMPELQREQSDPAKRVWSEKSETDSHKSVTSPTPAEAGQHEAR